jgi:hypothetical protein
MLVAESFVTYRTLTFHVDNKLTLCNTKLTKTKFKNWGLTKTSGNFVEVLRGKIALDTNGVQLAWGRVTCGAIVNTVKNVGSTESGEFLE